MHSLNKKMLSKKTKRNKSLSFLEKLYNMLEDPKNNEFIHWNEDGTKVVISDPIKFTINVLPKYFTHKNYSSFVRQLNKYGFSKKNNILISTEEHYFNEIIELKTASDIVHDLIIILKLLILK